MRATGKYYHCSRLFTSSWAANAFINSVLRCAWVLKFQAKGDFSFFKAKILKIEALSRAVVGVNCTSTADFPPPLIWNRSFVYFAWWILQYKLERHVSRIERSNSSIRIVSVLWAIFCCARALPLTGSLVHVHGRCCWQMVFLLSLHIIKMRRFCAGSADTISRLASILWLAVKKNYLRSNWYFSFANQRI